MYSKRITSDRAKQLGLSSIFLCIDARLECLVLLLTRTHGEHYTVTEEDVKPTLLLAYTRLDLSKAKERIKEAYTKSP